MHLYRNGIVEIVDGALLSGKLSNDSKQRRIPAGYFEQYVLEGVANAIIVLKQIGATGPIGIGVSLTNTKGMLLGIDEWRYQMQQSPVLNEHLFLPEAVLNELDAPAPPVMKPVIDLVWNACGMPSSLYLDADGKRRPSN
jgi:hypothetical protein